MYSAPSIKKYAHACQLYKKNMPMLCMSTTIELQEGGEKESTRTHIITSSRENSPDRAIVHEGENGVDNEEAAPDNPPYIDHQFDLDGMEAEAIKEVEHPELTDVQQELLHWHYRLNHLPFKRIQLMAKLHLLPTRLAKGNIPLCSDCLFGKPTGNHRRQRVHSETLK